MSDEFWVIALIAVIAFAAGFLVQWLTGMRMLLLLLLLPLAGEAGAFSKDLEGKITISTCTSGVNCLGDEERLKILMQGNEAPSRLDCLATMEAAMRAWDKFVNYNIMPHNNTPQELEDRIKGIQLWNTARDQCWRHP